MAWERWGRGSLGAGAWNGPGVGKAGWDSDNEFRCLLGSEL